MRELTQVEYGHLWSGLHNNSTRFAQFLRDYNAVVSLKKRIPFYEGYRGRLHYTAVMRESLPVAVQNRLDAYEATLSVPFVGGVKLRLIQGGRR